MRLLSVILMSVFLSGLALAQQPPAPPTPPPPAPGAPADAPAAPGPGTNIQETLTETLSKENMVKFAEVLQDGGPIMYPLYVLFFFGMVLTIYYVLSLRQGAVVSDKFMNAADALIRKQDYLGLIAVCNRESESIARITYRTLDFATKNPTASFDEVREVTEAEGSRQAGILTQRITYLADIAAVAPMFGLLGTVLGMIETFQDLAVHQSKVQNEISAGVSKALITTAAGLVVGILAMIVYSFFRGRVQKLISELEAAMTHLMALLAAQYKRANYRATARTETAQPASRSTRQPGKL